MKKFRVILAVLLIAVFALCALGSSDSESKDQGQGAADVAATEDGALGAYSVQIDSCRLAEDYEGKPVVIVKYIFTNVSSEESASFMFAFDDTAYQGGVGLNESYFVAETANYSSDNQTKEIKKGASIEVEVAYELNDTTTEIEVEVKELFSLDNTVVSKTFSIT